MMSEKQLSPEEARRNARVNIMQVLGNVQSSSPTLSERPPLSEDPAALDEIARERQAHVTGLVKTLQQESNKGPSPMPRSPRHSPTSMSPVVPKVSPPKLSRASTTPPHRPPPPRLPPRRPPTLTEHSTPATTTIRTDPPTPTAASPGHKPKPPVRTRKKKFVSEAPPPRVSEFVELSTSDIIVEEADGEIRVVQKVPNAELEEQRNKPETGQSSAGLSGEVILEEKEESGESSGRNESDSGQAELDLDRDDWEVIPDSATKEQSGRVIMDEPCLQPNGDVSKIEVAVKSLSVKKKRPPPFRPPPYTPSSRTPPLPPKKKKTVVIQDTVSWNQLAEEASVASQTGHNYSNEAPQGFTPEGGGHIYEAVDHDDNAKDTESDTSSVHLLSRPEHMLIKCTSVSSMDSDQSEGSRTGVLARAGTMSEGALLRKDKSRSDTRPKSEIPKGLHKEFESSFEVIPQVGSDLNSVMTSLRQADEKYQDASVYDLIQACSKALPHITSTSELPNRLPDFPDTARAHVIHELYTTEYTYVRGLEVLCEVFRDTLSPLIGEDTSHIFANVDDILNFNKSFLALLHSRLRELGPDASIGDLFIGMFTQAHKSMYAIYCSNYDSAETYVSRLKKRKDLEQALISCLSNSRVLPGLTLPAYLITPVQRIPRYLLLLKDIIKHTSEDHADRRSLLKAGEIMGELADFINAQVNESVTKKTFEALKDKVHGLADLDSADRNLVKEGQVYLKNIKKLYQCILFNDVLVFAHGDSRQSKVELQLNLEAVWFEDLEDLDPQTSEQDAIEIYTPERPYTIYTQSSAEKRLWMNKLRDTIYHYLLKGDKCQRNSTCATESRHASFIYSDGRTYNGSFFDSRRNGKGTMTWPNKTVYVGDWVDDERCGEGELTYNTGEVYRGKWSEDKQNGYGELQFASNDVYRGNWKDGIRHGSGKILYSNGDRFEGSFSSGQIEGKGRLTCVNGVLYEGEWKHSQRHGKGKLRTSTKNVYEGEFQYNQIHGQGTMTYENKDTFSGRWKNGMRNGSGKFASKIEGTYEGSWEDDLRHGAGKQVYPNKDVYEGGWERNKRHTRGKLTYSTGMVYEGEFVNDVICGEGEMRYSSNSKYQGSWVNGLRHGCGAMVYSDNSSYNGDWYYGMRQGHGEFVMSDGSVYRGLWSSDKPHGRGTLSISYISYTYSGDWVSGKREGRGEETSQYGQYKGGWKGDLKHGYGEERSLVGTIFEGNWEKGRKNGRGVRKMIFGSVDEQTWKSGQLIHDSDKMTAVELPFLSRNDS